jgi:hypothetical protein
MIVAKNDPFAFNGLLHKRHCPAWQQESLSTKARFSLDAYSPTINSILDKLACNEKTRHSATSLIIGEKAIGPG